MRVSGMLLFFFIIASLLPGQLIAQGGYVPPLKNSAAAKYDYENSHYSNKKDENTYVMPVSNKKDEVIIKQLKTSSEMTDDEYYDHRAKDAEFIRNGVLPPSEAMWKLRREQQEASEWPAKWPNFIPSIDGIYATVQHHGHFGVIDTSGRIIIPIIWAWASTFHRGLSFVRSVGPNSKCGFMNKFNTMVIPLKYDDCELGFQDNEELAAVKLNGKWGFIDTNDVTKIPFIYDKVEYFHGGFATVYKKTKCGVIGATGSEIIPIKYQEILKQSEQLFVYKYKDKWGAFDSKGVSVIKPIYEKPFWFYKGKAPVSQHKRTFYIDVTGKEVPK